jgi:hypothetical protein
LVCREIKPDLLRLDLRVIVFWLAACSLSIWLACGASCFFLVLGALVRFGLPAVRQCFLVLGAFIRFGSLGRVFFSSWLAALTLDLACLHPKLGFKKRLFKKPLVGRSQETH